MNPVFTRANLILAAFSLMLEEVKTTDGEEHPYVESFGPLVSSGIVELSDAMAAEFAGGPVPGVVGPQIPDDLFERVKDTGGFCALLAAGRRQGGPDHVGVVRWAGLVRSSIDEIAAAMLALLAQPGAVGEASE